MPHLIIEASEKQLIPETKKFLLALHHTLVDSGVFKAEDIKSRLYIPEASLIGITEQVRPFIAVIIRVFPGRPGEIKQSLIKAITKTVQANSQNPHSLPLEISVEIVDMDTEGYQKTDV
ncbi:5-carboxymethyl-2-hydroxymuconate Delta-isomerase [Ignatzschineria sp. LJL83]